MRTHLATRTGRAITGLAVSLVLVSGCASSSSLTASEDPPADDTESTAPDEPDEPDEPDDDEVTSAEGEATEPVEPPAPPPVKRPQRGDCFRLGTSSAFVEVLVGLPDQRPCRESTVQYASVSDLTPAMRQAAKSSAPATLAALTATRCRRDVLSWLGTDNEGMEISQFRVLPAAPTAEQVSAGADFYACATFIVKRDGGVLLPLPRSTEGILDTRRSGDYSSCKQGSISKPSNFPVVCSIKHNWRVVAAIRMGDPDERQYPGSNRLEARVRDLCEDEVGDYLGTTGQYEYGFTWPSAATWRADDRFGLCYAQTPN